MMEKLEKIGNWKVPYWKLEGTKKKIVDGASAGGLGVLLAMGVIRATIIIREVADLGSIGEGIAFFVLFFFLLFSLRRFVKELKMKGGDL